MAEAWRLAQLHEEIGQRVANAHGLSWRSLQTEGPREWLPVLTGGQTEDECRHVLQVLAAEADERARLGIRDPLRFLRTPTAPEVWRRAARLPGEAEAREHVRARQGSQHGRPEGREPERPRQLRRIG